MGAPLKNKPPIASWKGMLTTTFPCGCSYQTNRELTFKVITPECQDRGRHIRQARVDEILDDWMLYSLFIRNTFGRIIEA